VADYRAGQLVIAMTCLDMIRQGRAKSSKPCSVVRVSEIAKEENEREWFDFRIATKALVYCIVKIEAYSFFYPSLHSLAKDVRFLQYGTDR
jgi:hypothetical protein